MSSGGSKADTPTYKFLALVVAKTTEGDLLEYASLGAASGLNLAVQWLELPTRGDDVYETAIVSWRWDKDQGKASKNLKYAFRHAKAVGVRYLLIDIISIDQGLSGDRLLRQVLLFAKLYRTVPVIAAYDMEGADFDLTLKRPWIWFEANHYRKNPHKITYIGHCRQGCSVMSYATPASLHRWRCDSYVRFHYQLDNIWDFGLSQTIFCLIFGDIEMKQISDLKFFMPTFAPILTIACQKLSPMDYLLTAAVLCKIKDADTSFTNQYKYELGKLRFDRYSLNELECDEFSDPETEICFDGRRIGILTECISLLGLFPDVCFLEPLPEAADIICAGLGMSEADNTESEVHEVLMPDEEFWLEKGAGPVPNVEIVDISLV